MTWNQFFEISGNDKVHPKLLNTDQKLWSWFFDLHGARLYSDGIPQSITFTELNAWRQVLDEPALPHHIKLLRKMDGSFMKSFIKVQKEREANKT